MFGEYCGESVGLPRVESGEVTMVQDWASQSATVTGPIRNRPITIAITF